MWTAPGGSKVQGQQPEINVLHTWGRLAQVENSEDLKRVPLHLQLSTSRCMHIRKLPETRKEINRKSPGAHRAENSMCFHLPKFKNLAIHEVSGRIFQRILPQYWQNQSLTKDCSGPTLNSNLERINLLPNNIIVLRTSIKNT